MKDFSINSIALGNLRRRKKSYILLVTAVVLAIYFVATTFLFASMIFTSLQDIHNKRYGTQDVVLQNCKTAPLAELVANGTFKEYGTARVIGFAVTEEKSMSGGFSVASFDEPGLRLAHKKAIEGRLPEKSGEIAIEQSMLARLRTDAGIGDEVSLTLYIPDGTGFLENTVTKTYTLCGILVDQLIYVESGLVKPVYNDYPAAIVSAEEEVEAGGKAVIKCYGSYAVGRKDGYEKITAFCEKNGLLDSYGEADIGNTHYLDSVDYGIDIEEDSSMVYFSVFLILFALMLVFAACLGIVNAFGANLEERKRQIGLFRAVGATKKQIRGIFGREALLLASMAVPFGVLFACLTVWGVAGLLGKDYTFVPNVFILTGVSISGLLCVMLAAAIPLRKASTIPPMQAIRDVSLSRRMKSHSIKSARYFDVPRLLAHRSLVLYKSKRIGITAMLIVSIVLTSLISIMAMQTIDTTTARQYSSDYKFYHATRSINWLLEEDFHAPGITEKDKMDIASLPGIARVDGWKAVQLKILVDKLTPYLTADGYGYDYNYLLRNPPENATYEESWIQENDNYLASKEKYRYLTDYLTVDCRGIEENIIMKLAGYVSEGSIHPDRLASGEEIILLAPSEYGIRQEVATNGTTFSTKDYKIDPEKEYVFTATNDSFHAGDKITLSLLYSDETITYSDSKAVLPANATRIDKTVTIGAVIDPALMDSDEISSLNTGLPDFGIFGLLTTNDGLAALGFDLPYQSFNVFSAENLDAAQEDSLAKNLEYIASKTSDVTLVSYVERARTSRETVLQFLIICAAVLILFFSICASMVNNSISARIHAGQREIGTLRAVGASRADIVRSYCWQLFAMFIWGLVLGIAAEIVVCKWMILAGVLVVPKTFIPPIWQPVVFILLLFLLCFANIYTKVKRITKSSIVENIREL